MIYDRWDIILVPFPFTDLTAKKQRPALVLSPKEYNKGPDILVMFITSNIQSAEREGDYFIEEWKKAGLPKPSKTRMKLATLDQKLIIKKFARLTKKDIDGLKSKVAEFLGIN